MVKKKKTKRINSFIFVAIVVVLLTLVFAFQESNGGVLFSPEDGGAACEEIEEAYESCGDDLGCIEELEDVSLECGIEVIGCREGGVSYLGEGCGCDEECSRDLVCNDEQVCCSMDSCLEDDHCCFGECFRGECVDFLDGSCIDESDCEPNYECGEEGNCCIGDGRTCTSYDQDRNSCCSGHCLRIDGDVTSICAVGNYEGGVDDYILELGECLEDGQTCSEYGDDECCSGICVETSTKVGGSNNGEWICQSEEDYNQKGLSDSCDSDEECAGDLICYDKLGNGDECCVDEGHVAVGYRFGCCYAEQSIFKDGFHQCPGPDESGETEEDGEEGNYEDDNSLWEDIWDYFFEDIQEEDTNGEYQEKTCCVLSYQERSDGDCELFQDKPSCEEIPESGENPGEICIWNSYQWKCINLMKESCINEYSEECDHIIMHKNYGLEEANLDNINLPDDCSSIDIRYCGHGLEEHCDEYIDLILDINFIPGTCDSVTLDSFACLLAGDIDNFASRVEELCLESGFSCDISISANQCVGVSDWECRVIPGTETKINYCVYGDEGYETSYELCYPEDTECDVIQQNQEWQCKDDENNILTQKCCPFEGEGMVVPPGPDDEHPTFIPTYIFKWFTPGEDCPEIES